MCAQSDDEDGKSLIHLLNSGQTPREAACELKRSPAWAHQWKSRYKQESCAGLRTRSRAPMHIPVTEESLTLGGQLFAQNCSRCHGPEGQGMQRAPALNVKSFLTDTSDLAIQQIVRQGFPRTAIPAWGDRMTESEIQAVVGFIRQREVRPG